MGRSYTEEERLELAEERGFIVDPEDQWFLAAYTWSLDGAGYVRTALPGNPQKHVKLHHCIIGQPIDGRDVDHINRNKLDNRRCNLRYATRSINGMNSDRSDEAYHIYPVTDSPSLQVIIVRKQLRYYLGTFETIEAAEEARDQWLSAHAISDQT